MIPDELREHAWLENRDGPTLLLRSLLQQPLHRFSLSDLAAASTLTQAEAVKAIELLQADGVEIVATAPGEYAFDPTNERLHPDITAAWLTTQWWGRRMMIADELPSTIDAARLLTNQPVAHGLVVAAEHQTQGRGRQGAAWASPKANDLLLTFVIRIRDWKPTLSFLSLYAAVAAARVLDTAYGIEIGVKWPNDLVVNHKKLGGVLVEIDSEKHLVYVSLGLNVLSGSGDWPQDMRERAVSLAMLKDNHWDRNRLLAQIGSTWEALWQGAEQDHGEVVLGYCRHYSTTIGRRVLLERNQRSIEGLAREIDEQGRVVIENDDGACQRFLLEEVRGLRVIGEATDEL